MAELSPAKAGPSFGERAVRPIEASGDPAVRGCNATFALAIDQLHWLRELTDEPEVKRMAAVAITEAQTAQMWAVKALTWKA
jgi:hypothetical protein